MTRTNIKLVYGLDNAHQAIKDLLESTTNDIFSEDYLKIYEVKEESFTGYNADRNAFEVYGMYESDTKEHPIQYTIYKDTYK